MSSHDDVTLVPGGQPGPASLPQSVLLDEPGDARQVDLEPVLGCHLPDRGRIGHAAVAKQVYKPLEVALESARRDDLEEPGRLVPGVPEGVPMATGLDDQIPRLA